MKLKAVSACLCGVPCRYDGSAVASINKDNSILICPELLGGLSTPRNPVEIVGTIKTNTYDDLVSNKIKVLDKDGNDYSQVFIDAADNTLSLLKEYDIEEVILQDRSPSCGSSIIYDGSFNNNLI
ncbi:MAG: DUF523 domain-containing protein [Erysipelotrichales bacterium]